LIAEPRLFVAVPLDDATSDAVARIVARVRASVSAEREVRWVRLDGLHLTLRFLGPTNEERATSIEAAVAAAGRETPAFSVSLEGAGAFPPRGRPRAIWIGVTDGGDQLAELAARLDDELAERGWPRSDRPFRAHLTLARADGVAAGPATVAALVEAVAGSEITASIDRVALFETVTGGGPARYLERVSARLR
jgi:2'-5' RNA ligase